MKTISSTLVHRLALPEQKSPGAGPALILLHGRGADEEDLMGLASFLDARLLLIAVRAPFQFEYGGFTWYDAGSIGTPEPRMFRESCDRLSTLLDDILGAYPIDPARLFVLGFSMGAVMAYAMALTRPGLFRAVAANSGYLPEQTHLTYRWKELGPLELCITHGTEDPVIPVSMARRARDLFTAAGARVRYREYPMAHQISEESITDIAHWMAPLV